MGPPKVSPRQDPPQVDARGSMVRNRSDTIQSRPLIRQMSSTESFEVMHFIVGKGEE